MTDNDRNRFVQARLKKGVDMETEAINTLDELHTRGFKDREIITLGLLAIRRIMYPDQPLPQLPTDKKRQVLETVIGGSANG